jgi:hypothetical protein
VDVEGPGDGADRLPVPDEFPGQFLLVEVHFVWMVTGDVIMTARDYIYEPSGVMHEATRAIEDTVHLIIPQGPIVILDDEGGISTVINWEVMEKLRQSYAPNIATVR